MRTPTVTITCDLCGGGSAYSRPEDFRTMPGGVDLCYWCAGNPGHGGRMVCGRHDISIEDDWAWSCSCGVRWVPWMYVKRPDGTMAPQHVLEAVPNLRYALARIHSETM